MDGWVSSTMTMLGSVNDHRVKTSSISYVQEQLRNTKKKAYMPQVVTIGPLHRQTAETRRELLYMEEIKWRCMRFLLFRTIGKQEPSKCLEKCLKAIYDLDEVVRAAYTDPIKLNKYDLAKIMLLDGCFLLELLISNSEKLHAKLISDFNEGKPSPGAEVVKNELVLSDLKLLENQIPFFILTRLFQTLFAAEAKSYEGFQKIVNDSALSLFGGTRCSSNSIISVDGNPNFAHFLELVHRFMTREGDNHHVSETMDGNGSTEPKHCLDPKKKKPKQCAARLKAIGVIIDPLDSDPENGGSNSMSIRVENRKEVTFGCDKKFSKTSEGSDKLEIQPLHMTETTEVLWRNLIAWEQNRIAHERFLSVKERTRCKFSQYALLFKDLVCCEHDIQLLKKVVLPEGNGEKTNEDLTTRFQEMAKEIDVDRSMDESYCQLLEGLNKCSGTKWNCKILSHHWESFKAKSRYMCRDLLVILKRDYIPNMWKTLGVIAAIILLVLTVAQTILAAISL